MSIWCIDHGKDVDERVEDEIQVRLLATYSSKSYDRLLNIPLTSSRYSLPSSTVGSAVVLLEQKR